MLVVSSSGMGHPSVILQGLYAKLNSKCVCWKCVTFPPLTSQPDLAIFINEKQWQQQERVKNISYFPTAT